MKILEQVNAASISSWARTDYSPVRDKLSTLKPGYAMPVACDTLKEAQNLQYWVYRELNMGMVYGSKWSAVRRKLTVFITRAEHIPNEKRLLETIQGNGKKTA